MVLEAKTPSGHNEMLGWIAKTPAGISKLGRGAKQSPKKSTRSFSDGDEGDEQGRSKRPCHSPSRRILIPDSDAESGDEEINDDEPISHQTDLEQALPPIKTNKEAIQEYEAMRAADAHNDIASNSSSFMTREWIKGKSSIYVDAFNLALGTVLEDESHLFNKSEMKVFDDWKSLSYEAQYLYVRLFLRKTSTWHRINRLGYYSDIADLDSAIKELFTPRSLPAPSKEVQISPGELTPPDGTELGDTYTFADDSQNHITTLEEASSLLLLDELKAFAREAKVNGKNKTELLKAFRNASGKQTSLGFAGLRRSDTEESIQSVLSVREESPTKLDNSANRDEHFIRKILTETGPCIRISTAPFTLFSRVHLVFYRSTEWTEKSLTTIILARIARRNFPEYIVSRSANVFASRALLLEFEASLRTQFKVDNILEFNGPVTRESLSVILDILDEVYPRWQTLVKEEQNKEDRVYDSTEGAYLRRLNPAWVYTRIVHKGAYVLGLGKFKEHAREHSVLSELLNQRLFHSSRRGAWYQRKALLEEHYMGALAPNNDRTPDEQKKHWKRIALKTCEQGLQDNLVHIVHHYDLQKRVMKLEKALKIAKRLQHEFSHFRLAKPVERSVAGIRVERTQANRRGSTGMPQKRRSTKTIWLDPREDDGECSVEAMCLSWYRDQGWKGFHSEGGIIRTLFGLLFYDVLFTYVPNVFQTEFQTCPLDLHTDAFFATRISEVNARLAEIANGKAGELISIMWKSHAEKRTCIVGLDWNFELDDLLEIAKCFKGESLATMCKAMAQEYKGGGVPDLFLWHTERREVCFVEVKSENDRLSDTQRLWIHVLTGAGIQVELCHAVAKEVRMVD